MNDHIALRLALGSITDVQTNIAGRLSCEIWLDGRRVFQVASATKNIHPSRDPILFNRAVCLPYRSEPSLTLRFWRKRLAASDRAVGELSLDLSRSGDSFSKSLPVYKVLKKVNEGGGGILGFLEVCVECFQAPVDHPFVSLAIGERGDGDVSARVPTTNDPSFYLWRDAASTDVQITTARLLCLSHASALSGGVCCVVFPRGEREGLRGCPLEFVAGEPFRPGGLEIVAADAVLRFSTSSKELVLELREGHSVGPLLASADLHLAPLRGIEEGTGVDLFAPLLSPSCTARLGLVHCHLLLKSLTVPSHARTDSHRTVCSEPPQQLVPTKKKVAFKMSSKDEIDVEEEKRNRPRRSAFSASPLKLDALLADKYCTNHTNSSTAKSDSLVKFRFLIVQFYTLTWEAGTSEGSFSRRSLPAQLSFRSLFGNRRSEGTAQLHSRVGTHKRSCTASVSSGGEELLLFTPPHSESFALANDRYFEVKLAVNRTGISGECQLDLGRLAGPYARRHEATIRGLIPLFGEDGHVIARVGVIVHLTGKVNLGEAMASAQRLPPLAQPSMDFFGR